jgi:hypothetical protein
VSGATASQPSSTPTLPFTASPLPTASSFPTASPTTGSAPYTYAAGCNNASFVDDVTVPDGEERAPGETFTKTWKFLNSGTCAWTSKYSFVFVGGTDMGASAADLGGAVPVASAQDVSVVLTAPEDEGSYTGYWRLADSSGTLFGEQVYVQIVVTGDAATLTPTPTAETATLSPTATQAAPTGTPTPTLGSTATTEPTATAEGMTSSPTVIEATHEHTKS